MIFEVLGMGAEVVKIETLEKIGGELFLHRALGGPAHFVGGVAQVAVGDEENGFDF